MHSQMTFIRVVARFTVSRTNIPQLGVREKITIQQPGRHKENHRVTLSVKFDEPQPAGTGKKRILLSGIRTIGFTNDTNLDINIVKVLTCPREIFVF